MEESLEQINQSFASGAWDANQGPDQARFFMATILGSIPTTLFGDLKDHPHSIADIGTATGEGAALLAEIFPKAQVTGIDVSEAAIGRALARHNLPNLTFNLGNMDYLTSQYDVVFSSNVLEHFTVPTRWLGYLATVARKALVVLTPYNEVNRIPGHHATITEDTFPIQIGGLTRTQVHIIDTSGGRFWGGQQILQVWERVDE